MIGTPRAERRSSPRRTPAECAWLIAARLRPGREVQLLDLSSGGALLEAAVRLLPGCSIVLHLVGTQGPYTIRATVLRCQVCGVDRVTGVRYRAALAFDREFPIPQDFNPGYDTRVTRGSEAAVATGS